MTTAARSRDWLRRQGWRAEVVEHRRGGYIRVDMFGFGDVFAYRPLPPQALIVQAYHRSAAKDHVLLNAADNKAIRDWLAVGDFHHHIWSPPIKARRRWGLMILRAKPDGSWEEIRVSQQVWGASTGKRELEPLDPSAAPPLVLRGIPSLTTLKLGRVAFPN